VNKQQERGQLTSLSIQAFPAFKPIDEHAAFRQSHANMSTVYITFFTDKTEAEARIRFAAENFVCSHRIRSSVKPNDIVLMINHESGYVVGVARAASGCMDATLPELYGYTGVDAKYNKYTILIKDLVLLKRRVSQRDLRSALDVDDECKSRTNIYKGFPNSWQPAFIKSEDEAAVLGRLKSWTEAILSTN
jgi:hypothetical protein